MYSFDTYTTTDFKIMQFLFPSYRRFYIRGKDEEGDFIIDTVTKTLYEKGLVVSQFTSKTLNRKKVLYEFEQGYFDTLAAIRCFDEGVDVPKLEKYISWLAIVL